MLENKKFNASYCRLFGSTIVGVAGDSPSTDVFFRMFYKRLLRNPDIAAMFSATDMQRQMRMLKQSLFELMSCSLFDQPTPELTRIALLHRQLGISSRMLDEWFEALLETVEAADPLCDEATRLAWCWAMAPGIFYMKSILQQQTAEIPPHP